MSNETSAALPITEQDNPRSQNLSSQSTREIVALMNEEDATVAAAVRLVLDDVARAVDETAARLSAGGRLFYIGTGTSGRLGVLDASECPPTFGVSPELVQGVIAGGYDACYRAVEASEDDANAGATDLQQRDLTARDVVVGIAASGKTPYTVGAVKHARSIGAFTVALTCVPESPITQVAELSIVPIVGPEVLTGSSRLKAGTAQKMVLNMISTATMVRLGYVSGNRMANLQARNTKLRERAVRIVMAERGVDQRQAEHALEACGWKIPDALRQLKSVT
ncbi:MAG: N-acetylmuramic acid 6-phosphate etherase [Acidobacteria bacterium]|nr:N-acetylmuramic acid 6-phosphate etherase [Acidobacteriota bacterium]